MNEAPALDPVRAWARATVRLHSEWIGGRDPRPVEVWSRIEEVHRWLQRATNAAVQAEAEASPAAEWLLDNAFRVQRASAMIRKDLPRGFYAQLRRLDNGPSEGEPLMLAVAHDMMEASHFQLTREGILGYLEEYQKTLPLSIAELWALPVMLRLACLERLMSGFALSFPRVPAPVAISISCQEHMAGDPTHCVARAIANLAVVSSVSWKDVFEAASLLERRLRAEPAGIYAAMDFDTRDSYCRAVERLARRSGRDELAVVDAALSLAGAETDLPARHVGNWLVGPGLGQLEAAIAVEVGPLRRLMRILKHHPGGIYGASLFLLGLIGLALPALYLAWTGANLHQWLIGLVLSILPTTVVAVTAVNWLVTHLVPPHSLPKLDFASGIAPEWPTLVVVPVIVGDIDEVGVLARRLESHYLANPSARAFVLLSDPVDAGKERVEGDEAIEAALRAAIGGLNSRYAGPDHGGPFCLLHRARRFNPAQGVWMAWERKRGKLEEFNAAVLGAGLDAFPVREGPVERIAGARFVVTADADTRLPPGTVHRMAGTLAHPLNRPVFDATGRVCTGYTILQPRVEIAPSSNDSPFARLFGGDTAIDIYSRAVSDVYQDLVGTGNFVGKGIYDVAAFDRSVSGRVPENSLLSHDLWEGLHGRAGLVSDIIVYESFPESYAEYARRWHRWVRGDWQLLPWLMPYVAGTGRTRLRNYLTVFDRMRLWDNMRRSLVPVSVLLLLLAGWFLLPGHPLVWTILGVSAPGAYLFTDLVSGLARGRRRGVLHGWGRQQAEQAGRWAFSIAFLVSDSVIALHAIATTLLRLGSGHNLLEWTSAAAVNRRIGRRHPRQGQWQAMWPSSALVIVLLPAFFLRPAALPVAAPLLVVWLLAPELALWSGRKPRIEPQTLGARDRHFLRLVARRSWYFFETFVTPHDNWLPPDNHQEEPLEATAPRTSPTNIGMMVVSAVAAWKMGHIGTGELAIRMRAMLDSLDRLEQWHGHILNWYDTTTLEPLAPRYVSTVDSGNLAASLIVLGRACTEIAATPLLPPARWEGLDDCLALLEETIGKAGLSGDASLATTLAGLRERIGDCRIGNHNWARLLPECEETFADIRYMIQALLAQAPAARLSVLRELRGWMDRTDRHLSTMRRELDLALPWRDLLAAPPASCRALAEEVAALLSPGHGLADPKGMHRRTEELFAAAQAELGNAPAGQWLAALRREIRRGLAFRILLARRLKDVASRATAMADGMDFRPLYDRDQRLFFIGYDLSADRIDTHHYDLLASEARLASFFAIAKHDVPAGHWFKLSRPIVKRQRKLALVSWNGSMFEYLMPTIFLRSDPATLLGESDRSAIALQRAYCERMGVPWGVSESCFAALGPDGSWRYRAFGVPGLGLRRGLSEDLVIAPYATVLALGVEPLAAARNLERLAGIGALGRYGFAEALDFTPSRRGADGSHAPVWAYMAHHQGMSIGAIANALFDDFFIELFHADPRVQTVELLLNERVPWELPPELERIEPEKQQERAMGVAPRPQSWNPAFDHQAWQVLAIGNGRLETRIASDGSGELHWKGLALTRPDVGAARFGHYLYLRDEGDEHVWSPTPRPVRGGTGQRCLFHGHKAEFHARHGGITASLEVFVAPDEDVEIRRLRLVNDTAEERWMECASHVEVALAPTGEWLRHPAFSRLFVAATAQPEIMGVMLERRARDPGDLAPVMVQRLVVEDGSDTRLAGWESSRENTLGRHGRLDRFPAVADLDKAPAEYPLDPVCALRAEIRLAPHGSAELAIVTAVASSHEDALDLARRYGSVGSLGWAEQDSHEHVARTIQAHGVPVGQLPDVHRLNSLLVGRRGPQAEGSDRPSRDDLWAMGLSGDLPILLFELGDDHDDAYTRFALAAHRHLHWHASAFDLVFLHAAAPGYVEPLREHLTDLLRDTGSLNFQGQRGGVHVLGRQRLDHRHMAALEQAAAVRLHGNGASITEQLAHQVVAQPVRPSFAPPHTPDAETVRETPRPLQPKPEESRAFDNGWGGFGADGDYRMDLDPLRQTPAPWANVLANPGFGTIVSEAGLGFTFCGNSGENRLTPWFNDALCDPQGEALYLRDEDTGEVWTVTMLPAGPIGPCQVTHDCGSTRWHRRGSDLEQTLTCLVDSEDPVKLVRLSLKDLNGSTRRITATYFADWQLGAVAGEPGPFRHGWFRPDFGALLATSHWHHDFAGHVAFLAVDRPVHSLTTSRQDFLGEDEDRQRPAGLVAWDLGNRTANRGEDTVAALQVHLELAPDGTAECCFVLGQAQDEAAAAKLARRWQSDGEPAAAADRQHERWNALLGAVRVETPDPAFDLMVNRWLAYQAVSSRLFARGGYYQAGGAYGFRDQLQDVEALLFADPELSRAQILRAAAHQFEEGDVLHWWHPPTSRGVRTRYSDDLLWLPHAVARHVAATGEGDILDIKVPHLRAPELTPHEHDRYSSFPTGLEASVFDHCLRAFERAWRLGGHGLPLIGGGDWNDGMNRIGAGGDGESVWLGWFLASTIADFAKACSDAGRPEFARHWQARSEELVAAIEAHAWDGDWYVRAFDDQGRPWGSKVNDECRIDSLTQSWAAIAGSGNPERKGRALDAAYEALVRADDSIVRLLDPPFDKTPRDPGYIKAYPPGIRENGGQYSHASAWLGIAFAQVGDGNRAKEVFDRLNPILHSQGEAEALAYRTEPYALAADIAGEPPHVGRGGWTWYSGGAGWTWRLGVEHILGIRLEGGRLAVSPQLPDAWPGFKATLSREGTIELVVKRGQADGLVLDGQPAPMAPIAFPGRGKTLKAELVIAEGGASDSASRGGTYRAKRPKPKKGEAQSAPDAGPD